MNTPRLYLWTVFVVLLSLVAVTGLAAKAGAETLSDDPVPTSAPPPDIYAPKGGIPDGYTLIEGDILVRTSDLQALGPDGVWNAQFWPNGIVPFEFDANVTAANQQHALNAMGFWEAVTNVDFHARDREADFIHLQDATGNSSQWVGRLGGEQSVDIRDWDSEFIVAHELGHVLGIWHEQSRVDRDAYIQIESRCIGTGREHNFAPHDEADVYPLAAYGLAGDQTYDFDSVMHYPEDGFLDRTVSGCTRTITVLLPWNTQWQTAIGQRNHLSRLDQLTMSFLYPQGNWRFVDRSRAGMESGTFLQPYQTFGAGVSNTPTGGTLWVQPGTYATVGTYSRALTLRAPLGGVTLGN